MFSKQYFARLIAASILCAPLFSVAASWDQTLVEYGNNLRTGLYAFGGSIALSSLVWSGIRWLLARANGDQSQTFMDYIQQVLVIMAVGGAIVLAAGAWQVFGSGSPL